MKIFTKVMLSGVMAMAVAQSCETIPHHDGYELVWNDEFDYEGIPDPEYWSYDEGYMRNNELQEYKSGTGYARVDNGVLVIEAHVDDHDGVNKWTGEPYHFGYSSGEVVTRNKVPFRYGRIDISAKIPHGRGIWPAIWMMPVKSVYGGWPKSGEIDIMEYVWEIGEAKDHRTIQATVHTEDEITGGNKAGTGCLSSETFDKEFHVYSLVWEEDKMDVLVDDEVIYTYIRPGETSAAWPFDQDFYLILNVAVGGSWGGKWGVDDSIFPASMEIDYVRYYRRTGE